MTASQPLVSVGLPTFNRADRLRRAIDSVLSQDYASLELIICDNASSDGTQHMCEEYARQDSRIVYRRQATNCGMHENFKRAFAESHGAFFMWMGDDDWLDRNYLSSCSRILLQHADHELVVGRGRYFIDGNHAFDEDPIDLLDTSACERVLSYYRTVGINGMFYGLMRREMVAHTKIDNVFGGDWLFLARIAFQGKARTLEAVAINRSTDGASGDLEQLARQVGVSRVLVKKPLLAVAYSAFRDIAWRSPIYSSLSRRSRFALGLRAAEIIGDRYVWTALRSKLIIRTRLKRCIRRLQSIWTLPAQ